MQVAGDADREVGGDEGLAVALPGGADRQRVAAAALQPGQELGAEHAKGVGGLASRVGGREPLPPQEPPGRRGDADRLPGDTEPVGFRLGLRGWTDGWRDRGGGDGWPRR